MLYVIVMLCRLSDPVCDERHAIDYRAFATDAGIVCGPLMQPPGGFWQVKDGEFVATKCRLGAR